VGSTSSSPGLGTICPQERGVICPNKRMQTKTLAPPVHPARWSHPHSTPQQHQETLAQGRNTPLLWRALGYHERTTALRYSSPGFFRDGSPIAHATTVENCFDLRIFLSLLGIWSDMSVRRRLFGWHFCFLVEGIVEDTTIR
jgi:hypothetical protein